MITDERFRYMVDLDKYVEMENDMRRWRAVAIIQAVGAAVVLALVLSGQALAAPRQPDPRPGTRLVTHAFAYSYVLTFADGRRVRCLVPRHGSRRCHRVLR